MRAGGALAAARAHLRLLHARVHDRLVRLLGDPAAGRAAGLQRGMQRDLAAGETTGGGG